MSFGHDLRASRRQLLGRPFASAASAAVLALGLGSSAALFSIVDAVLLRPLPYPASERLVAVWDAKPADGLLRSRVSGFNYLRWREEAHTFESIALLHSASGALLGLAEPLEIRGLGVTCELFAMLGIRAQFGRALDASDCAPDAIAVIVISHALWQRRFGGDPSVVGRRMTLEGEPVTIAGVLPRVLLPVDVAGEGRLRFAEDEECYWAPFRNVRAIHGHVYGVLGLLRPERDQEAARAELRLIAQRLERASPDTHAGFTVRVDSVASEVTGTARQSLPILLTGALLLLSIACANVAQFQLSHAIDRAHASAVRAALGASRAQLWRPFVLEGLLLAAAGGLLGTALALAALRMGIALLPLDLPRLASTRLDLRSLAVAFLLTLVSGALTGLLAAWRAATTDASRLLRGGSRLVGSGSRLRQSLLVVQAALAVVLVAGAALLGTSLGRLASVETGFDAGEVLIVDLRHASDRYRERQQLVSFYDQLIERAGALSGVRAVGASYDPPLLSNWFQSFRIVGEPEPAPGQSPGGLFRTVTPGFFRAAGVAIAEGRGLSASDDVGAVGAAVVNHALARRYFGGRSPLGRQISLTTTQWIWGETVPSVFTIVGIAEDERIAGLDVEPEPAFYLPYRQTPQHQMSLLLRTAGSAAALVAPVTRVIHEVDAGQPLAGVTTIHGVLSRALARPRLNAALAGAFGLAALGLAALGLSAALAESVSRRQRELGMRLALGCSPRRLFGLAIAEGLRPALLGSVAGAAATLACGQLLASQLYGVKPWEPSLYAAACACMLAIALVACAAPAWRAARTDPAAALRHGS